MALTLSGAAHAAIYDLAADWSDASNPNGVWTYREGSNALGHVSDWYGSTLYSSGTAQPAWATGVATGAFLPAVFKATSGGADNRISCCGANQNFLKGDIVAHTTDGFNGAAFGTFNILFTAPSDGTADISGLLWNARIIGDRPQGYSLYVDGVLAASGAIAGLDRDHALTFGAPSAMLAAGDTVMLQLYRTGSTGDFVGIGMTVDFTPTIGGAVPEPSTWAMMLVGFAGLGFASQRRKKPVAVAA
ncbi:MAG: hypothetical protein BGP06_17150 [Rhizobiales bacterium 65-9]|nr:MAG: hypothetical protein BGP06_17150 [Rhizobiales bacterium 65-9]